MQPQALEALKQAAILKNMTTRNDDAAKAYIDFFTYIKSIQENEIIEKKREEERQKKEQDKKRPATTITSLLTKGSL